MSSSSRAGLRTSTVSLIIANIIKGRSEETLSALGKREKEKNNCMTFLHFPSSFLLRFSLSKRILLHLLSFIRLFSTLLSISIMLSNHPKTIDRSTPRVSVYEYHRSHAGHARRPYSSGHLPRLRQSSIPDAQRSANTTFHSSSQGHSP